MSAIDRQPFPRGALIAAGALIVASILAAGVGRWANQRNPVDLAVQPGPPAQSIELRFRDRPDGSVAVTDGRTGETVAVLKKNEDAFVRGVMRSFVRDRRNRGLDDAVPFVLQRWDTGHVAIADPLTGRTIDLRAFGVTNQDAFVRFLPGRAGDAAGREPARP